MTDQMEQLFRDLRDETLPTIIAPGPDAARATVRRKREIRAVAGSVLIVAVVAVGVGALGGGREEASPAASAPPRIGPAPDPSLDKRFQAVADALGDPDKDPWVMATQAAVEGSDYENDINDIGEGKYFLLLYCAGPGRLSIRIKADQYGDKTLATGTVPCREQPVATRIRVTQPHTGYLRLFAHAEAGAAGAAALSFKFVRAD